MDPILLLIDHCVYAHYLVLPGAIIFQVILESFSSARSCTPRFLLLLMLEPLMDLYVATRNCLLHIWQCFRVCAPIVSVCSLVVQQI